MSLTIYGKSPSVRRLYKKLRALGVSVTRHSQSAFVLRWRYLHALPFRHMPLNTAEAIRNGSNKLKALQIMKEAGVRTVPFATRAQDLIQEGACKVLGRNTYHTKGRDIVLINFESDELIPTKSHYTKFLEGGKEYRYHMFKGRVLLATVKMTRAGQYHNGDVIRNHQGGRWRQVSCAIKPYLEAQARKAMTALGLDFGAVDMIFHEGKTYVLEVNTAPALSESKRIDAYATAIRDYIRTATRA